MTWTGFERQAGAAKIFFQVSGAVEYTVQPNGNAVEVRIRNVRPAAKNNLRALDLREKLAKLNVDPTPSSATEFEALVKLETKKWADVIKRAKITVD